MIFGIGLPFTGTINLTLALNYLGYRAIHFPHDPRTLEQIRNSDDPLDLLNRFHAAVDLPLSPHFKKLDCLYPGSKFILTLREEAEWRTVLENYWSQPPLSLDEVGCRQILYDMLRLDVQQATDAYPRHVGEVLDYFQGPARSRLLVMDIHQADRWDKLCPYLEIPIPTAPFPYPLAQGDRHLLMPVAKHMQSYRELLVYLCRALSPKKILEWGPGESTLLMAKECPDARILSIEHDRGWHENTKQRTRELSNVELVHVPHLEQFGGARGYVTYPLRRLLQAKEELHSFDLIFVDGRSRCDCLTIASLIVSPRGLVVLHDSARRNYLDGLNMFPAWKQYWDITTAVAGNDLSILDDFKLWPGVLAPAKG